MKHHYEFHGRKPSFPQVMGIARHMADNGVDELEILWGENWIELQKINRKWVGHGWIKQIDGQMVAESLNVTTN